MATCAGCCHLTGAMLNLAAEAADIAGIELLQVLKNTTAYSSAGKFGKKYALLKENLDSQTFRAFFFFLFFNACIICYYLSKPLTSLSCPLNAVFPGHKMWDTFAFDCFDLKPEPGHRV
jgi:hypothetical protein